MLRTPIVAMLWMLVIVLLASASAFAQVPTVVPSPPWGEPINTPDRFVVLASYNNDAVYDQETGLVWEKSPSGLRFQWQNAQSFCNDKAVGNRKGWRIPTVQELASLVDPSVPSPGPTLPAGHPFKIGQSLVDHWSATALADFPAYARMVNFFDGSVSANPKYVTNFVWCVRGGQGPDAQ